MVLSLYCCSVKSELSYGILVFLCQSHCCETKWKTLQKITKPAPQIINTWLSLLEDLYGTWCLQLATNIIEDTSPRKPPYSAALSNMHQIFRTVFNHMPSGNWTLLKTDLERGWNFSWKFFSVHHAADNSYTEFCSIIVLIYNHTNMFLYFFSYFLKYLYVDVNLVWWLILFFAVVETQLCNDKIFFFLFIKLHLVEMCQFFNSYCVRCLFFVSTGTDVSGS